MKAGLEHGAGHQRVEPRALHQGYDELRPLFERQQTTMDTLQSLALLQSAHSNRSLWYVLIADQTQLLRPTAP